MALLNRPNLALPVASPARCAAWQAARQAVAAMHAAARCHAGEAVVQAAHLAAEKAMTAYRNA